MNSTLDRRDFLKTMGLVATSLTMPECMRASRQLAGRGKRLPNILFILADDLGWCDVGYHGSEIMTPNIDRLAKEGVRLDQHYVTPTCSPTRTGLMSGRFPKRFGVVGPTNERVFDSHQVTLAGALRNCGYDTGITGKWHLGSRPEWGPLKFGFNRSYGSFAGGVNQYLHLYKKGQYSRTWHRNDQYVDEEGHTTDLIAREAIRWIEALGNSNQPFFIYVAFTAVHIPIQEPPQWVKLYDGKINNESRKHYAACATHMDDRIGKIIDALKRSGQRENTLIVFTSDNGAQRSWKPSGKYPGEEDVLPSPVLGSNLPLRGWKGDLYEGGIRVPTLVNWPSVIKPGKVAAPVHIVDWMPTFCGMVGYKSKQDLKWDGADIWPLIMRQVPQTELRTLYWKTPSVSALRHNGWKLIVYKKGKKTELYNLVTDPYEKQNLTQKSPKRVADLKALLDQQSIEYR